MKLSLLGTASIAAVTVFCCCSPATSSAPLVNISKVNALTGRLGMVSDLLDRGLYNDCVESASALIDKTSTDDFTRGYAFCLRGLARSFLDQPLQAIRDIDSGLEINPYIDGKDDLYGVQAACQFKLGRLKDAIIVVTKSLAVEPSSLAYRLRGVANLRLRKYKLAIKDFDEALKYSDCPGDLIQLREMTAAKLGTKKIHTAWSKPLVIEQKSSFKSSAQNSSAFVCHDD